jgi:hypothetical protein
MIGATVAMAVMAGLFIVFGMLGLADRGSCGGACGGCACERDNDIERRTS